jgi:hygromycin-B 7''-O-kinase
MAKDFYVQPDAADPVLDARAVLAIVHRHAPDAVAVTAVDESGGEARTYAIDDGLILKVQRPQQLRPRTSLAKERLLLRHLADREGIRVPRLLGGGVAEPGIDYTLMSRMPGVPMLAADLDGDGRRRVLLELGRMLRRIHAVPQQALFDARLIPGDHTPADVRARLGSLFDDAAAAVARAAAPWPHGLDPLQLARLAMRALPDADVCVALHSNPGPEHVFVDAHTGALTGLIDFGDAYFSHPALDLRRWHSPVDRAAVHAGYGAGTALSAAFEQTWRVACLLADMQAFAHEPACRAQALEEIAVLVESLR